jgi:hypothetical protein
MAAGSHVGRLVTHFTGPGSSHYPSGGDSQPDSPSKPSLSRSASPVRRQITGGSGWAASRRVGPMKSQLQGGGFPGTAALVPQLTGSGLPITRTVRSYSVLSGARANSTSPIKTQWTGSSTADSISGNPLSPNTTGGGLFVNRPRPKSVLGTRGGLGSSSSHRGIGLVRQMTGGDW